MQNLPFTAFDLTPHPLFAATSDIAATYAEALRENSTESFEFAKRQAASPFDLAFLKSGLDEMAALQFQAATRLWDAHQKAAQILNEQSQSLTKFAEMFSAKV